VASYLSQHNGGREGVKKQKRPQGSQNGLELTSAASGEGNLALRDPRQGKTRIKGEIKEGRRHVLRGQCHGNRALSVRGKGVEFKREKGRKTTAKSLEGKHLTVHQGKKDISLTRFMRLGRGREDKCSRDTLKKGKPKRGEQFPDTIEGVQQPRFTDITVGGGGRSRQDLDATSKISPNPIKGERVGVGAGQIREEIDRI